MALRNTTGGAYSAAAVRNDAGTVVKGGTPASDSPIQNVKSEADLADDFGTSFGSKVVAQDGAAGDYAGVAKAVSGGTLAYQAGATNWVVRGGNVTTALGGVANDILVSPARDTGDLNDFATEAARTKISDRLVGSKADETFNIYARPSTDIVPGRNKGTGAGNPSTMYDPAAKAPTSTSAVAPTQAVPGELTYFFGELAAATTDEYKSKVVAES